MMTKRFLTCPLFFPGIAKLVSALLDTNNLAVNVKLMELKTIDILLVSPDI